MRIFGFLLTFWTKINTNSAKSCLLFRRKGMVDTTPAPILPTGKTEKGKHNRPGPRMLRNRRGAKVFLFLQRQAKVVSLQRQAKDQLCSILSKENRPRISLWRNSKQLLGEIWIIVFTV